uniref:Uncharacterized protein n=1 Tax=Arundo donax TaxID=35708 RepID=A0A0A9CBH1_ARUDO
MLQNFNMISITKKRRILLLLPGHFLLAVQNLPN